MKIKNLSICIFLFVFQFGQAQLSYTNTELQSFVDIYMDAKLDKRQNSDFLSEKMIEHQISKERYKHIFKSNINGQNIQLSQNEINFFDDLEQHDKNVKAQNEEAIKQLCASKGIAIDRYLSIKNKYKTDIQFQRSLKPYFDQYLNKKR